MDLVKTIKNFKGEVLVEVPFDSDVLWVKVYKNDLLRQLQRFADPSEAFETVHLSRTALYVARKVR